MSQLNPPANPPVPRRRTGRRAAGRRTAVAVGGAAVRGPLIAGFGMLLAALPRRTKAGCR